MTALNKHEIFACSDLKTVDVDMKAEWGGTVKIKVMSIGDRLEFEGFSADEEKDIMFKLLVKSCVDETGSLIFNDNEEDIKALKRKDPSSIIKLFNAIMKINKMGQTQNEEAAKNS